MKAFFFKGVFFLFKVLKAYNAYPRKRLTGEAYKKRGGVTTMREPRPNGRQAAAAL